MNRNNGKKIVNRSNTSNWGKSLLIVNLKCLRKYLGNKTCLIPFNSALRFSLGFVNPFTANCRFTIRQVNHIPSVSFLQDLKFLSHCLLSKKISTSLMIGLRLMNKSNNILTRIITQMNRRCSYPFRTTERNGISLTRDMSGFHGRFRC